MSLNYFWVRYVHIWSFMKKGYSAKWVTHFGCDRDTVKSKEVYHICKPNLVTKFATMRCSCGCFEHRSQMETCVCQHPVFKALLIILRVAASYILKHRTFLLLQIFYCKGSSSFHMKPFGGGWWFFLYNRRWFHSHKLLMTHFNISKCMGQSRHCFCEIINFMQVKIGMSKKVFL